MLIRFAVQNFMSFRDLTELRMSAGSSVLHSGHLINKRKQRFLKGTFIFGPNSSGKSNFIKAVSFASSIITDGIKSVSCEKKYFRVEDKYKFLPGVFQFDIASGKHFYSYGFAISYTDATIQEEWLYCLDNDLCIFERQRLDDRNYMVSSDLHFSDNKNRARFDIYVQDIKSHKMEQTLFYQM